MKKLDTPNWLKNAIGMRYYDIEIKDAYIAINTNRPQGFDLPVVFLELDSKILRKGYWYYHPDHNEWYWSGGEIKAVVRKVFNDVIKDNFDPESYM